MRIASIITFFCLLTGFAHGNTIDNLKTDKEVENFIFKVDTILTKGFDLKYRSNFTIDNTPQVRSAMNCNGLAAKWKILNWQKFDFNADGHTDLIAYGHLQDYFVIVIIDNGNGTFTPFHLGGSYYDCTAIKPLIINQKHLLLYNATSHVDAQQGEKSKIDTLIYKFGEFIEYNKRPSVYHITKVKFQGFAGMVYNPDDYPPRTVEITTATGDADCIFYYIHRPKETYKTTLDKSFIQNITALLNYISIKRLPKSYAANITDAGYTVLTLTFSDGSVKTIEDHGGGGTLGYTHLENLLSGLEKHNGWQKVN